MRNVAKITAILVAVTIAGAAFSGCTASAMPETEETPVSVVPSAEATTETTAPTATATPSVSEEQIEYENEIASWPEALPQGYTWPSWDELPHVGSEQLAQADNASGVYRCILLDAAWHAYFEDDDAEASRDYAVRADSYAIPENPSLITVTENGAIIDAELAAANGICRGISGELS